MLFILSKGRSAPGSLHVGTRRRLRRGMLPGVGFSRAMPDCSRPSPARRIMRPAGLGGGRPEGRGSQAGGVGDTPLLAYNGDEASTPDDSSGACGFARAA